MLVQELFEARQKGVKYTEHSVRGKVTKIVATLEGAKSGKYTKLAGNYKRIDEALKKLQEERSDLNTELKKDLLDLFDAEDAVYTRVVETVSLTAQLTKQSEASDKTDYKKVVERLLEDATPELEAQIRKLIKLFTTAVGARSPALTVNYPGMPGKEKVDEGVVSITIGALKGMLKRKLREFKSWASGYDKKLEKIRGLLSQKLAEEDSKSLGVKQVLRIEKKGNRIDATGVEREVFQGPEPEGTDAIFFSGQYVIENGKKYRLSWVSMKQKTQSYVVKED